jgi:hypothetical protein
MFDFPHPLGPTMPVIPGWNVTSVRPLNDLNPEICNLANLIDGCHPLDPRRTGVRNRRDHIIASMPNTTSNPNIRGRSRFATPDLGGASRLAIPP